VSAPARLPRMNADEFIPWAITQPEEHRYELVAGEVVAMSPERAGHNKGKLAAVLALREAIRNAGLPCRAYTDGMAVRVDASTVCEPDALVRCGKRFDLEAVEVTDPVIVVEVISPSTDKVDTTQKLADYFRLASVQHYLIVNTSRRSVVHHQRDGKGGISTRITASGRLALKALLPEPD
jgi:Uma2 family endonuclease